MYVEDLCVTGLGRTRLAKSVHDAGWTQFTTMLEYKAARFGRTFGRVDRFFPSTRMCSDCGRVNDKMALNVRVWVCPCGSHHDRDVNAARNIRAAGRADLNDRGAQIRRATLPAPRSETVTHRELAPSGMQQTGIFALQGAEDVNGSASGTTSGPSRRFGRLRR
ncbi:RNA-guided endonuclease InsQ/TnpB family protein [Micromonospora sp. NPDC050795]|uniref:RNA-guided endonuclease InsQ/TnpB family protein n=1 Tax=Micromonospora sp. NPDC050795 TaxID=3364282 RepID=UPI00378F0158